MSKFWGGSDSSDTEDEVSDKEVLSDNEDGEGEDGEKAEGDIDWGLDDSSEDEDAKRVVKSVRDKRYEEMNKLLGSLDKDIKEADWVAINTGIYPHADHP